MTPIQKAKSLLSNNCKEVANKIVDNILNEIQSNWNQTRIDFYLDVKNEIQKL